MLGWIAQKYAIVPGWAAVNSNDAPWAIVPESRSRPLFAVTVCGAASSFVHSIVSPALTFTVPGPKAKPSMATRFVSPLGGGVASGVRVCAGVEVAAAAGAGSSAFSPPPHPPRSATTGTRARTVMNRFMGASPVPGPCADRTTFWHRKTPPAGIYSAGGPPGVLAALELDAQRAAGARHVLAVVDAGVDAEAPAAGQADALAVARVARAGVPGDGAGDRPPGAVAQPLDRDLGPIGGPRDPPAEAIDRPPRGPPDSVLAGAHLRRHADGHDRALHGRVLWHEHAVLGVEPDVQDREREVARRVGDVGVARVLEPLRVREGVGLQHDLAVGVAGAGQVARQHGGAVRADRVRRRDERQAERLALGLEGAVLALGQPAGVARHEPVVVPRGGREPGDGGGHGHPAGGPSRRPPGGRGARQGPGA